MKKFTALFLVVMCVAMAIGCAAQPAAPAAAAEPAAAPAAAEPAAAPAEAEEKYTIVCVAGDIADGWHVRMAEGMTWFEEETGHAAYMKGPTKSESALQVQVLEDLIAQDIDALVVTPIDAEVIDPILKKARDKGIVVIAHEGYNLENIDFDIEADTPTGLGEKMMESMAQQMNGEGKYTTMVAYLTYPSHNQWADSGIAYQKANYPNMELIEPNKLECEDNVEISYERTKEILKAVPDLGGILGVTCFSGPGIAKAVEELGLSGKVAIGGSCIASLEGPYFESGTIKEAVFWDPKDATYAACNLAVMLLENPDLVVESGIDLGLPGWDNMQRDGKVLYGQALGLQNVENYKNYPW